MPLPPSHAPARRGVLVAALLALWAGTALGSKPRCRLEAVIPRDGEILALGGVVELEGQVDADRPPSTYALLVNGKEIARADRGQPFERSGQDAYVVLAVEISALYAPAIEKVKDALREFLDALPPRTKVRIIQFGAEIGDQGSFVPAAAVTLDDILPDDEGDIQLTGAITAGLRALQAAERLPAKAAAAGKDGDKDKDRPPPRRLLIAISDGLNPSMERRGFRQLGDNLRKAGIAFFPVAFSPRDDRFPLLNLGELAKRSGGTFRWAQKDEQIKEQFLSLAEEIKLLQVLRFAGKKVAKLDEEDLAGATFSLRCGDLVSPPYTLRGEAMKPQSSRWYLWVAGVLGGLVALWGLAQLIALWLRRRAPQAPTQQQPWQPPPQQPWPQPPIGTGAYPQQPAGTGAYPQQPIGSVGTGAYPQQPIGTGAYPQQPDHGRVVALPSGSSGGASIILIGGPAGGQQVVLTPPVFTLGKGVASGPQALQVADPTVSSRHCELRHDPAGWVVVDLGSTNGTYVNDHRITAPTRLRDGDLVRIGVSTQFKLRLD